ncbi:MAG: AP2 domain-containing protein [Flavobacterium sp.]|uniref:AP2 domain-containing protein n=1 Tax=Flavobacterium sp. TaxID=239 RepID=UPI002612513C|nr:AP2 domain-containing protein [Flavobacterium sp.]MDD5149793.1 AP2 domain-containing protein [Flavobacterium sp.]
MMTTITFANNFYLKLNYFSTYGTRVVCWYYKKPDGKTRSFAIKKWGWEGAYLKTAQIKQEYEPTWEIPKCPPIEKYLDFVYPRLDLSKIGPVSSRIVRKSNNHSNIFRDIKSKVESKISDYISKFFEKSSAQSGVETTIKYRQSMKDIQYVNIPRKGRGSKNAILPGLWFTIFVSRNGYKTPSWVVHKPDNKHKTFSIKKYGWKEAYDLAAREYKESYPNAIIPSCPPIENYIK